MDDAVSVHFRVSALRFRIFGTPSSSYRVMALQDLGYITRPIWDRKPPSFKTVLTLADAESSTSIADLCQKTGLLPYDAATSSGSIPPPKVYDVILFSVELDLLEIRLRELYDEVDQFLIVEANVTFSGEPKELSFEAHKERFAFAKEKIVYAAVTGLHEYDPSKTRSREDPFVNEVLMRQAVSSVIDDQTPEEGDIILQSDVDEIPSAQAIRTLKNCQGWGDIIHLGMPTYLYSFEFPMLRKTHEGSSGDDGVKQGEGWGTRQWRASAKRFHKGFTGYTHSRQSDTILEYAGWHCSFCFRYIRDFQFKMTYVTGYAHMHVPSQTLCSLNMSTFQLFLA